ncbi:hypothetical protein CAEBREN_20678 [Caenorhabditis brenneri]|uniref:Uncharacterized protein n=1 Tax=Caenorhabditis brenneri TaxID=135651 RepID=G0N850_CAEBE|nr:hypothetical protein CAEBREN_20678 [Caenorhabditis brenneri]
MRSQNCVNWLILVRECCKNRRERIRKPGEKWSNVFERLYLINQKCYQKVSNCKLLWIRRYTKPNSRTISAGLEESLLPNLMLYIS